MITKLDKNTALVLIDLQEGIINFPLVHPIAGILENANKLIAAFRNAGLPIIFVNVNPTNSPLNIVRKDAPSPKRDFDDAWYKISAVLSTTENDIYITKNTWNAFTNPVLHETLQKLNITEIVLAGVSTSIGVEGTARAASELGYNIAFAIDATTDMVASAYEHSTKIIFPRIGEVGNAGDIVEKLS